MVQTREAVAATRFSRTIST